jgi:hypothetical protein
MTLSDELSAFLNINQQTEKDEEENGIFNDLVVGIRNTAIQAVNKHITNLWDESTMINDIDFKKILSKM